MKRVSYQFWAVCVVSIVTACQLAGCGFTSGIWTAGDATPSTSQLRYEFEVVPNATLAKESTSPEWQLGRYVFLPGNDRLLVISRITSWMEPTGNKNEPLRRRDHMVERVWIVIPAAVKTGQEVNIGEMESLFLAGYDSGDAGGSSYIRPNRLLGFVTILEDKHDTLLMNINMAAEPQRLEAWRVKQVVSVPVMPKGIRATAATDERAVPVGRTRSEEIVLPPANEPVVPPPTSSSTSSTSTTAATPAASSVMSDKAAPKTLMGKWLIDTGREKPLRVQLDKDGRYALSPTGPGDNVVPSEVGTYVLKNESIELTPDRQGVGEAAPAVRTLRISWQGDSPVVAGDLLTGTAGTGQTLKPTQFGDMRTRMEANASK